MKSVLSFILIFSLLAVTVVCSAVVMDSTQDIQPTENEKEQVADTGAQINDLTDLSATNYTPRLTAPAKTNKYYYSDENIFYKYGLGMPNCTCYAWGRAYEILKKKPDLCIYSAYLWYDYNKENKYYSYGQTPKLGAIACWAYKSGTDGHVAVVEKITSTTITFSNSAWSGSEFYTNTAPINNPCGNNSSWIFQGYIYIGDYQDTSSSSTTTTPDASGDVYRITSDNGVNMRSGPGTSYSTIGAIGCGQTVTVTKTQSAGGYNWGYTTYDGKTGWFVTDFAELVYTTDRNPVKPSDTVTAPADIPTDDERKDIMGDVDQDGKLSILDATLIQKILVKKYTPTQYQLALCDYDGDNKLSVLDATQIQKYLAKTK